MTEEEITAMPGSVLAVDDEPIVLQVLQKVLPARGFVVTCAASAEEAIERCQSQTFDCLLTDKNLPGMNGLELIEKFRDLQPDCACIVMTGYASMDSVVQALRLGANDYLEKPFQDLELVAEKVDIAIQNQRAFTDRALFLRQVVEFRQELDVKDREVAEQQLQIRAFNEIVEHRVLQATKDLRSERDELRAQLNRGSPATEGEAVAVKMAKMLLEEVILRPDVAPLRGDLQRIMRQLEDHLRTLGQMAAAKH